MTPTALIMYLHQHPVEPCQPGCPYPLDVKRALRRVQAGEDRTEMLKLKQMVMSMVADGHLDWTPELGEIVENPTGG